MKYQQLSGQVKQLWLDHHGGVPLVPVSVKLWIQGRVSDALIEYSDTNVKELYKHLAWDMRLSEIETVQMTDWLSFSRDYGFSVKVGADGSVEP